MSASNITEQKHLATLKARAALAGIAVHVMTSASGATEYVACRWNLTKAFASLEQLETWLDRFGAPT